MYASKISGVVLALLFAGSAAIAVPINYGDFSDLGSGGTVIYRQVTEDSTTDPTPQYGPPSVFVNTLKFTPIGFGASVINVGGSDITDGQLNFGIDATIGNFIDQVILTEKGDYTLVGPPGAGTYVSAAAPVILTVTEVDGVNINPIVLQTALNMTPLNGVFSLTNPGPTTGGLWSGDLTIDVEQLLIDEGVSFVVGATKAIVAMDNTMTAYADVGHSAFIAKKDVGGFSITVTPEPSTVGLLLVGLVGMALRKRR